MALASEVIRRVRYLINDETASAVSGVRWTDAELLDWISEAQRQVVALKPEANVYTDVMVVSGGQSRQRLTAANVGDPTPVEPYRLIRVEANSAAAAFVFPPTMTLQFTAGTPVGEHATTRGFFGAVDGGGVYATPPVPVSAGGSAVQSEAPEIYLARVYTQNDGGKSINIVFLTEEEVLPDTWEYVFVYQGDIGAPDYALGVPAQTFVDSGVFTSVSGPTPGYWTTTMQLAIHPATVLFTDGQTYDMYLGPIF